MILGKYNQAKTITFDLFDVDGIDLAVAASFASGDVLIQKDEGAEANTTNLPTDEGASYSLVLTATEMQAARIRIIVRDQTAPMTWLPITLGLETYGNASAEHAFDLDTASTPQTADNDVILSGLNDLSSADVNAACDTALTDYDAATGAEIAALNDFDPANDDVAVVTLVNTTTTNTDMVSSAGGGIGVQQQVFTRAKGATSQIIEISVQDSSSAIGAMLTGLVYNTSSLTAYYNRIGSAGAATEISLVTATKGTWVSGGFIASDATNQPGKYQLHLPDAAIADGADGVSITLKGAADMVPVEIYIDLVEEIDLGTDNRSLISADVHTSGVTVADVTAIVTATLSQILGTALTETTAARLADNISTFFDNADADTSKTVDDVGVTGSFLTQQDVADALKLAPTAGSPAAGSVNEALDNIDTVVDTVKADTAAILIDTDELQTNQGDWATATGFATAASLATVDSNVDDIKAETDKLTFTVANELDVNLQSVNDVTLVGDGSGTPFNV